MLVGSRAEVLQVLAFLYELGRSLVWINGRVSFRLSRKQSDNQPE